VSRIAGLPHQRPLRGAVEIDDVFRNVKQRALIGQAVSHLRVLAVVQQTAGQKNTPIFTHSETAADQSEDRLV
jgi:hypothetical protein